MDRLGDLQRERARVADAGGAAVADEVELELVQIGGQARVVEVAGDDLGPRREAGLDPGLGRQAALDRLLGHQAGGDHDRGVGRVGARGDRGDHHRAVLDVAVLERPVGRRRGRRVLGADGGPAAAFAFEPGLALGVDRGGPGGSAGLGGRRLGLDHRLERLLERRLGVGQPDPILGPLGPGQAGLDGGQVEFQDVGVRRLGHPDGVEQPLGLGVGLDQVDQLAGAAREFEVADRLGVDREDPAGGAIFGGHVGDRGPVGQGEVREAVAVELDELADDPLAAQLLGHGQDQVGRRGPFAEAAVELEADDLRHEHRDRLAEHRGLGLDPADAPAQHAEAVDHRRVRVGPDQGVGIRQGLELVGPFLVIVPGEDDPGEVFEVDLVDDPCVGRDGPEVPEGVLAPAEEGVPLAVPAELELGVGEEGGGGAGLVDLDRVVDHQLDRLERVDLPGVAAHPAHGVAHRREVDHGGHAGEVLQEDPAGTEGDLAAGDRLGVPAGQAEDILAGDGMLVLVPEEIFEEDLEREREPVEVDVLIAEGFEAIVAVVPVAHGQGRPGLKAIEHGPATLRDESRARVGGSLDDHDTARRAGPESTRVGQPTNWTSTVGGSGRPRRPGQEGPDGLAAPRAVVDGPLVDVHPDEAVGQLGVEVAGVVQGVVEGLLAVGQGVLDAPLDQARRPRSIVSAPRSRRTTLPPRGRGRPVCSCHHWPRSTIWWSPWSW